ncbi:hypothetical protein AB3R30_11195 [Leptolyngbyaceae cyanobacterium UHCC 1019]
MAFRLIKNLTRVGFFVSSLTAFLAQPAMAGTLYNGWDCFYRGFVGLDCGDSVRSNCTSNWELDWLPKVSAIGRDS